MARLSSLARFGRFTGIAIGWGAAVLLVLVAGCGGGGGGGGAPTPAGSGTVTTTVSDPASDCTAPNGPYTHVWVTVSDVTAHTSPSDTGAGVDLTPGLSKAPKQVDLLAASSTECILATLGSTSGLQPATYQQIRLILLANNATGVGLSTNGGTNQCANARGGGFNCVVLAPASSCTSGFDCRTLNLPSEATTGLKIPPGQIGGITVAAGKGLDIDIDFNACTSVVQTGKSGNFNLKPTLRELELGTSPLIAGQVVEAGIVGGSVAPGSTAVPGANVWLEQQPASPPNFVVGTPTASGVTRTVDSVVQTTLADINGHFEFCPVGAGSYEIVADSASLPSLNLPSDATISTGVGVTASGGPNNLTIPLVAQSSPGTVPAWAQIVGEFTTQNVSAPGDDVAFAGLQPFIGNGDATVQAIVPVLPSLSFPATAGDGNTFPNPPVVTTTSSSNTQNCHALGLSSSCPAGTNCKCFVLALPGGNPVTGVGNSSGTGYAPPAGGAINYAVSGVATAIGGTTSVCSVPNLATNPFSVTGGAVTDTPAIPTLSFTGCD